MSASSWTAALQPLGWTLVLVLWQTVLLALLLSASGSLRRPSAQRRHRDALVALLAALPLGVLTFCTLAHAPEPLRDAAAGAWRRIAFSHDAEPQVAEATSQPVSAFTRGPAAASRSLPDAESARMLDIGNPSVGLVRAAGVVIPWGAALWAVIAVIMVGRLAGGLCLASRIRRRARQIQSADLAEIVSGLARRLGISRPVALLESADLDAPIATGWRWPAVILPLGLYSRLRQPLLEPLMAHELEHVRRRDQLVAVIQALADALVFFSPGTRWLSRQVCLAREQACDDAAVRVCGDAAAYAAALGSLVGVMSEKPTFLPGAEAPPLAARIRRVLEGEPRKRMTCWQGIVLALAAVGTALSGVVVGALSFADTLAQKGQAGIQKPAIGLRTYGPQAIMHGDPTLPSDFLTPLPGAPVIITGRGSGGGAYYETVRVRNVSEERVTSVTFAAVVAFVPRDGAQSTPLVESALVIRSRAIPVSLAPSQDATVSPAFLTWSDLAKWSRTHAGKPHPTLTLIAAERAVSGTWQTTPEPRARNFAEVFRQPAPRISKKLLGVRPASPLADFLCRGERGWPYWPGAVVLIDGEKPPKVVRCAAGVWRAYELPSALEWGAR